MKLRRRYMNILKINFKIHIYMAKYRRQEKL